ncbi:motility-associated protein [Desulfovibrio sp. DV]|uniref:motility-associated protein n=1 Tax=Desulfovibrio sp. DV TaxID=1844708 RepID=UPI0020C9AEAE|nr:motility-associated protein [Desulfovibrio sp. DV]
MLVMIGAFIVIGCLLAGFLLENGNFGIIISAAPAELLMIVGGAFGALVISCPKKY